MSWSSDTRCLYCDGKLALYRKLANGQFCSAAHRKAYWGEQERLAVERLHQTHDSLRAYRPAHGVEAILGKPVQDPSAVEPADVPVYATASSSPEVIEELARTASNAGHVVTPGFLPDARVQPVEALGKVDASGAVLLDWNTLTVDFLHAMISAPQAGRAACKLPFAEAITLHSLLSGTGAPAAANAGSWILEFEPLASSAAEPPPLNALPASGELRGAIAVRIPVLVAVNWFSPSLPAAAAPFAAWQPHFSNLALLCAPETSELSRETLDPLLVEKKAAADAQALAETQALADEQAREAEKALALMRALAAEQVLAEEKAQAEMLAASQAAMQARAAAEAEMLAMQARAAAEAEMLAAQAREAAETEMLAAQARKAAETEMLAAQARAAEQKRIEEHAFAELLAEEQAQAEEKARAEERLWAELVAEEQRLAEAQAAAAANQVQERSAPPAWGYVPMPQVAAMDAHWSPVDPCFHELLPASGAIEFGAESFAAKYGSSARCGAGSVAMPRDAGMQLPFAAMGTQFLVDAAVALPTELIPSLCEELHTGAARSQRDLPSAVLVPMPSAMTTAQAGVTGARPGSLEPCDALSQPEEAMLTGLSAVLPPAAPAVAGGSRYPVSNQPGGFSPVADVQPCASAANVHPADLPLATDASVAGGSAYAPMVRMELRGAIRPAASEPVCEPAMLVSGLDGKCLPALKLEPIEGIAAPSVKRSFLHPSTWVPNQVPDPRHMWTQAGDFWKHAPRDLKILAVAIPILVGLALNPSMPKVRVSAPTATGGVQSGLQRGFERRMREQFQQVRRTVAERAAVALNEDFRAGLDDWQTPGDRSTGWSFDRTGFVKPATLALYRPSMRLTDYETQFLGLIDNKALSFVARAQDFKNYYVIKLVVTQAGATPTVSITRYAVIDGKSQSRVDTAVEMFVQKDTLYRATLAVHGDTFLLGLQGKIVDTWSEPRLLRGGIGFFAARGEESRLRWVQVTHQYDMLGRLCAYLAPQNIPTTNGSW